MGEKKKLLFIYEIFLVFPITFSKAIYVVDGKNEYLWSKGLPVIGSVQPISHVILFQQALTNMGAILEAAGVGYKNGKPFCLKNKSLTSRTDHAESVFVNSLDRGKTAKNVDVSKLQALFL